MAGGEGGTKVTVAALVANFGIACAKFVAFAFTASASMLAEGIHSVADTSNQALLLLGRHRARKEPTSEHPFGYGRERYFWAFVVAIILFALGSLFSIFEGVEKLRHPHEITSLGWAIGVLAAAIVLESAALTVAVRAANAERRGRSWWGYIRRAKAPEIPVVLLEDIGALLGLVVAMVGVVLAETTGDPRFDAMGSLAIGVLLGIIAVVLAVEMKSLLIGESASLRHVRTIRDAISSDPDLVELLSLRTMHLGPDQLLVAAKVRLSDDLTFSDVAASIDRIEGRIRELVPITEAVYVEPDQRAPEERPVQRRDGIAR